MPNMTKVEIEMSSAMKNAMNDLRKEVRAVATAVQKLAETPPINIVEPQPFFCPTCGALTPEITSLNEGGSGLSAEFVLYAECHSCNHPIYAIPLGWNVFSTREQVKEVIDANR